MATGVVASSSSSNIPEDAQQAIISFLNSKAQDATQQSLVDETLPEAITNAWLNAGQLRLVEAVKFLGPSLTSEDENARLRAVVLLSLLITALAKSKEETQERLFDKQAITTLATFFAQKIEDGNTVAGNVAQSLNAATPLEPESAPASRRRKFPIGTEMLVAALRALLALSKMDKFGSEAAKLTTEMLLNHSSPRVHPQAIRFLIFTLMDTLLSRRRQALKQMGQAFVNGYIELVEGEKDPRNLVYIFAMDRVILIEWDTMDTESIENFFDCTYCYFPITFRPPPDDPYGITTNSLRIALRRVLCASPLLAPHALPLLIEKMQASGGSAKRDTLDTLADALPVFGRSAALAHARELWQGFRIEIIHATDEATSICAQRALQSLLFVLFVGEEEAQSDSLAPEIAADMLDELEEPSKQQARAACTILAVMIRATISTCRIAIKAALDQLLGMYKQTDDISIRPSILMHLHTLVNALRETYAASEERKEGLANHDSILHEEQQKEEGKFTFAKPTISDEVIEGKSAHLSSSLQQERSNELDGRPMDDDRDLLISTVAHGLGTTTTRGAGVDLFVSLSHIDILTFAEQRHLCASVNDLLLNPSADQVRVQALDGLRDLGNKRIVEETTLPMLFNALPDRIDVAEETSMDKVKGNIRRSLGALARLCDSPEFFELLIVRLGTKLDLLCASEVKEATREANVGYARGLFGTLAYVLQNKMQLKHRDTAKYGSSMVPRILGIVIFAAISQETNSVARDWLVVRDAGRLIMLLVQCIETAKQQQLSTLLLKTLYDGTLQPLSSAGSSVLSRLGSLSDMHLTILSPHASRAQRDVLFAFTSAIVAFGREAYSTEQQEELIAKIPVLLTWTMNAQSKMQEEAGSFLMADWINKFAKDPVSNELQSLFASFWDDNVLSRTVQDDQAMDLDANGQNSKSLVEKARRTRRAIRVWLAVTRGFLIKNSKQAEQMVARVLALFDDESLLDDSVLNEAARSMGVLLRDDEYLCKENGSIVRLLYRQRFVTYVLPRLLDGHKRSIKAMSANVISKDEAASHRRRNDIHLVAICSLLPSLPRAMLMDKLQDLFPLLILALDVHGQQDEGVVQASAAHVITLAAAIGKRQRDEAIMDGRASTALGRTPSEATVNAATQTNSLDSVQDQLGAIVRRLLAIVDVSPSSATKIAALRCLKVVAQTIEYTNLHPYKHDVLRALGAHRERGIDDAKRDVRLEAVDCRDAWFRLKGQGEDEEEEGQ